MEYLLGVPLWLLLLGLAVFLLYIYGTQPFSVWKDLGVKGPAPVPFFGNMLSAFDKKLGFINAVHNWQKQYGRVFGIYFFRKPVLVIMDPDVLKQVLIKDFDSFVERYTIGDGDLLLRILKKNIFFEDGANWRRIRRIMSPTFSSGKVKLVTHHVARTAQRLGENLRKSAENGSTVDAKRMFGAFTMDVICGTTFGLDTNSQQTFEGPFIKHIKSLFTFDFMTELKFSLVGSFPILGKIFKAAKIGIFRHEDVKFLHDEIHALVAERKASNQPQLEKDYLQLLLNAEAEPIDGFVGEKKLTTEEVVAQAIFLILAGAETTATHLQFLCYELAKHPYVQSKILSEMKDVLGEGGEPTYDACQNLKYTEAVINEALRMYPSPLYITRHAVKDTTLAGIPFPSSAAIIVPSANIGRDPEFFPDPDTFRPERFFDQDKDDITPITFLPFGFGPRKCLGMRLAILEIKIALVHILRNVRFTGAAPDVLDIEDYTSIMVPRVPIQLDVETAK